MLSVAHPPPRSGGGGPREAWWRGRLTRRFTVVGGVSSRPAPLPPRKRAVPLPRYRGAGSALTPAAAVRQISSPRAARPQLGDFLVASVIAAFFDVVGRDLELRPGLTLQFRDLFGARHGGLRRIVLLQHAIERRERLDARKRKPCAFERQVAEMKPYRPRLGDFLDLVEIARGAVPIADVSTPRPMALLSKTKPEKSVD